MKADSSDPTEKLAEEVGQIARAGAKARLVAGLSTPNLLSLPCVTAAAASDEPYDLAVALVGQIEAAIERIDVKSRMGAAALALFGLDFDTRDLTLQDRRDRAAQHMGIRGGWDSFRRAPERKIAREIAEQLYGMDRPKRESQGPEGGLVLELPALFDLADASSISGQRRFLAATRVRLIMLTVGAGAGGLALVPHSPDFVPLIVAAAAFVGALCADLFIMQDRPDRVWFEGRAAAESAKSLAWRYAVGGEPFALPSGGAVNADRLLVTRLNEILQDLGGLGLSPGEGEGRQITQTMRDLRAEPLEVRKLAYGAQRIDDQRSWYASRAKWNAFRARRWTTTIVAVEALGAMIAVLKLAGSGFSDPTWLLGLCGASGAAAVAWSQTRRHQEMATSYSLAANELASIGEWIPWQDAEQAWAEFVGDAERAISREHSLWRVSRGVRDTYPLHMNE